MKQAFDVLQISQLPKKRPVSVSLIYLQCLVLAILEADHRGPDNLLGKNGATKTELLQMAVGVGHALIKQLNLEAPRDLEADSDSDKNLIRRNWIILVVLDRFHALSVGNMKTISAPLTNFSIVEKKMLGTTLFYLAGTLFNLSRLPLAGINTFARSHRCHVSAHRSTGHAKPPQPNRVPSRPPPSRQESSRD